MPSGDLARVLSSLHRFVDPRQTMLVAGKTPDPWQERLLLSTSKRVLVLCSRQIGKSESTAAKATHECVFRPPAVVGITSDSQDHSKLLLAKAREYMRLLEGDLFRIVSESTERIDLSNGSYAVALPGTKKAVRGHSLTLGIVDEGAFTTEELIRAFEPTLDATKGSLYALTSAGEEPAGWFWRYFTQDGRFAEDDAPRLARDEWERYLIPATECPRVFSQAELDAKREKDPVGFAREYMCRFGGGKSQVKNPLLFPVFSDPAAAADLIGDVFAAGAA